MSCLPEIPRTLTIELLSDSTFSRGEGTAGMVTTEIEHDAYGMPFIGGKTIRGLLRDSWLTMSSGGRFTRLEDAAVRVLGHSKALDESCRLRFGDGQLPPVLRLKVREALKREGTQLSPESILNGFTAIRTQSAQERTTGAPDNSLRSSRVVRRGYSFASKLLWLDQYQPTAEDGEVLALCALATRHGGLARNRGRGHIRMTLDGNLLQTQRYAKGDVCIH